MRNKSVIAIALTLLGVCSCKKSKEQEYDLWADKATNVLQTYSANWTVTNGIYSQTNEHVKHFVEEFGKTVKADETKKIVVKTVEAGEFLLRLHDSDLLPGISKNEHGQINVEEVPVMTSNKLVVVTYPMERTFHVVKDDYTSTNSYVVVKQSQEAEWKLQRAWETDSKGQIIQEWPVK